MVYLPTLGEKWPHSRVNVSKYTIHGSYGNGHHLFFWGCEMVVAGSEFLSES